MGLGGGQRIKGQWTFPLIEDLPRFTKSVRLFLPQTVLILTLDGLTCSEDTQLKNLGVKQHDAYSILSSRPGRHLERERENVNNQ